MFGNIVSWVRDRETEEEELQSVLVTLVEHSRSAHTSSVQLPARSLIPRGGWLKMRYI